MTDNSIIFEPMRPWLDRTGYNDAGRRSALDAAIARAILARDPKPIYDTARPWLDGQKFNPAERRRRLDAAFAQFLVRSDDPDDHDVATAATLGMAAGGAVAAIMALEPAHPPEPHRKGIADFIAGFIDAHEGGLSMDRKDNGNWTGGRQGVGRLVGSKFGVTSGAVAAFRGVPASSITAADIANLTRDEAIRIGVKLYYEKPGLNLLPLNRVTLSIIDKGWGSGPRQAIKLIQREIGVGDDGAVGQETVNAYKAWLARLGEEAAARRWAAIRIRFDTSLGQPRFIRGWNNRTNSFLPGTAWWSAWA